MRSEIANGLTYYNGKKYLDTSDSQAFLVYGRTKPVDNLALEPYYIWKREEKGAVPAYSAPAVISQLCLNTFGARAVYKPDPWTFGGEFAYQFGEYDGDKVKEDSPGKTEKDTEAMSSENIKLRACHLNPSLSSVLCICPEMIRVPRKTRILTPYFRDNLTGMSFLSMP